MRRTDRAIIDAEHIERILRQGRWTAIALTDGLEPYVVTLSYGYDAESRRLYFHVAPEGRKLDVIARCARACATVVLDGGYANGECEHPFESAVVHGTMRIVTDPDEKRHAIETLVAHLEEDPDAYWASRSWRLDDRMAGFTALSLHIESVTAKRGK